MSKTTKPTNNLDINTSTKIAVGETAQNVFKTIKTEILSPGKSSSTPGVFSSSGSLDINTSTKIAVGETAQNVFKTIKTEILGTPGKLVGSMPGAFSDMVTDPSKLINLYTAYSYGGSKHAGVLATTSFADSVLSKAYGINKNYISLSSFWGYVAYKAIKEVNSSDTILSQYKMPLYVFSSLIAAGIVWQGEDLFGKNFDGAETLGSIKLTASFFDDTGVVKTVGEKFKQGTKPGIVYTIKNLKALLSNKFILYSLAEQGVDIAKLLLVQKFFQALPSGKMAAIFANKDKSPFKYLAKLALIKIAEGFINEVYYASKEKLSSSLTKDINTSVTKLVLQDKNTQTVMEFGDKLSDLSWQIKKNYETSSTKVSSMLQKLVMPFTTQSLSSKASTTILDSHPSMVLLESLINTILRETNLLWLRDKLYHQPGKSAEGDEYSEMTPQKFGLNTFNTILEPDKYAFTNIQEIAKLGGNQFMLNKVLAYINRPFDSDRTPTSIIKLIRAVNDITKEFIYGGAFMLSGIDQEKLFQIEADLNTLMQTLNISSCGYTISMNSGTKASPEEIESTIVALREKHTSGGPARLLNEDMTLSLKDYHLGKKAEQNEMMYIPEMQFTPGKVYAITGEVATGKTTFLTDIAKCLMPVFKSQGSIYYPIHEGRQVEEIFCGTVPFAPPATTLLERLTYRMPTEYVTSHKDELLSKALALFTSFGQTTFTSEKLQIKGNDTSLSLSTGQGKIVMLISAILFKQYLNKPALFVIDETLANLDISTTNLVCRKIKEVFSDSIVISVDHHAAHNSAFYSDLVDLSSYKPFKSDLSELEHKGKAIGPLSGIPSTISKIEDESISLVGSEGFDEHCGYAS